MMASVDAEAEMENLFAEDEAQEAGTQSLTQEEGELRNQQSRHNIMPL